MYLNKRGKVPNQAHVRIPEGLYEEEHGRNGFVGPASHLYRTHPPTSWINIEGKLKPRAFACTQISETVLSITTQSVRMLQSQDASVYISWQRETMPHFVRNADGEEVHFVHQGRGRFETDYGVLPYEPGDYVVIPKGTTYRTHVDSGPSFFLVVETPVAMVVPERGALGQHALFDKGVLLAPELKPVEPVGTAGRTWEVHVKHEGGWTKVIYPFYPMDVVGWKGDLWVAKLNVRDIRPVVSPRYHLPPSVHQTFQAGGCLISTFVPRPLESDPEALHIPFYHRNTDYDEVLFYHDGEFFSRSGIRPGMLTLHPQGIHHGPQPQAVQASKVKTHTSEVAVMVESKASFTVQSEMESVEMKDYALSWSRR